MSIIRFDILEDHLKLVPFMKFKLNDQTILSGDNGESPFGGEDVYEDMGLIIYGKVEDSFDPLAEEGPSYDTEQKEYMDKLLNDIPKVLEIVLNTSSFQSGEYKRKYHDINWKRSN